jgi:hypothetical protein
MPVLRPPSAIHVGHCLGGSCKSPPPCTVASVHCAILRRSCTAGGVTGGFAALGRGLTRLYPCCQSSHHPSIHNGPRCAVTEVRRYATCSVVRRGTPWPLAGDANALNSVVGHGTILNPHRITGSISITSIV